MQPPIGRPRCYDGSELPVLYPGEVALPQVAPGAIEAALAAGLKHGSMTVQVTGWLVEPTPGVERLVAAHAVPVLGALVFEGAAQVEGHLRRDEGAAVMTGRCRL